MEGSQSRAHLRRLAARRLTDRRKAGDIVPVPAYIIERLSARDYEALVDLWRDADLSYRPLGRDSREAILAQMVMPHCRFLGVRGAGDVLLASAIANHEGRKGWINRLAVRRSARRSGIARALVAACERWLESEGIAIVAALVEGENRDSQLLFTACGYDRDDTLVYFRKVAKPGV